MSNQYRQHGYLMIESMVTISIIALLAGVLSTVMYTAGKGNRQLWARQQAMVAAEAQLDCLTRTAAPLPEAEFKRLWPDFTSTIEFTPGAGPDEGLYSAAVTVTGYVGKKRVRFTSQRDIPRRGQ